MAAPNAPGGFRGGQRARNAAPGVLDRQIDRRAISRLQPILGIPDLAGDWRGPFDSGPNQQIDIHGQDITLFSPALRHF